jgi:Flp pilus assembly protein TadG
MSFLLCLLLCGLSVDYGRVLLERSKMQTAADAAAIAAEFQFERNPATYSTAGAAAATAAGYTDSTNNTNVTFVTSPVVTPVSIGSYSGQYDGIQVQITKKVPTFFMNLGGMAHISVSTTAVSVITPCLYFLGSKSQTTYTASELTTGGAGQLFANCAAYVGGKMSIPSGAWWQADQTYLTGTGSVLAGTIKAGTTSGASSRSDPLATSVTQPTVGACNHTNYSVGTLSGTATTQTLSPGVYCGSSSGSTVTPGMTLLNGTITFSPGLYVITGGANWQKVTLNGSGVTFFFTNVASTTKYGSIVISTTSNVNTSAPSGGTFGSSATGGALSGILFFLSRNWVNTTAQDFNLNSSSLTAKGVWYMPDTGIQMYNGSSTCTSYCGVIADNITFYNWQMNVNNENFSAFTNGNPFNSSSVLVQ